MNTDQPLLTSTEVMTRYGYKCRKAFWEFVHKKAVPHISFNARKKMFSPAALEAWEARRSVGGYVPDRPARVLALAPSDLHCAIQVKR